MSALWANLLLVGAPVLGLMLWFLLGQSMSGERYIKQRIQGPFVPLDKDEK